MAQEQILHLNMQLEQTKEHLTRISNALDALRSESSDAVSDLRRESSDAVADIRRQLANAEAKIFQAGKGIEKKIGLVNLKNFEPRVFAGKESENIKTWARRIKGYCNGKTKGFKTALEWAEIQTMPIDDDDLLTMNWEPAVEANDELYEYLTLVTSDDALTLVEKFKDNGFEAWRQLMKRYNPLGGRFELDRMTHLLRRKACKALSEVPSAVDALEKDIAGYEARSANKFPEEWKAPLLIQLLPESHRNE